MIHPIDQSATPKTWTVPNRKQMRDRRFSRGAEQLGRSRSQRITNAERRADRIEHERKMRQAVRREIRRELPGKLEEMRGAAAATVEALGRMSANAQAAAAHVAALAGQR